VGGQHGTALGWVLMHHYLYFLCHRSAARRDRRNRTGTRVTNVWGSARRCRASPRRSRLAS
jgi:hypothetical protein